MRRSMVRWLVLIVATVALAACGGSKKKGSICVGGDDCPSGQGCFEESCVSLCDTTCETGKTCVVINGGGQCVESEKVKKSGTETQDMSVDSGAEDLSDGKQGSEDIGGDKLVGAEDQTGLDKTNPDTTGPDSSDADTTGLDGGGVNKDTIILPPKLELTCGNIEGSVWVEQAPAPAACRDLKIIGGIGSYKSSVLTSTNFAPTPPNLITAFPNVTLNSPCDVGGMSASVKVEVTDGNNVKVEQTCGLNCIAPLALSCASYLNVTAGKTETTTPIEWTLDQTDQQISLSASGGWLGTAKAYSNLDLEIKDSQGTVVPYGDLFDKALLKDLTSGVITFGGKCKKEGSYTISVTVQDQPGTCYANVPQTTLCNVICKKQPPQDKFTIPKDPGGGMITINNWMLMMDDGGVDETVMITYKELISLPDLGGVIAAIELQTDKPAALCKWLKVKYDISALPVGKTYALLVSYDGGQSWYDMMSWLDTNLLWGQLFQQTASLQVAIVEVVAPLLFTQDSFGPPQSIVTSEVLKQIDAKVISAQVTGTFKGLRRISVGDPNKTTLEFSFVNAQFVTKKLQYEMSCESGRVTDTLLPTDVTDSRDKILTEDGADDTKKSQDSIAAHDLRTTVTDGTTKTLEAATRLYHVVTQSAHELQMLTALTIDGVSQLIKFVVSTQAITQNRFKTDVWTRIFTKKLLITRVRHEYFFESTAAELFIRSLWNAGQTSWQRFAIPGNKTLAGGEKTYRLIEARVSPDYLFVLALKRQAPSVSCAIPTFLLQHLTLFVFDTNLRLVKSVDLPNLSMPFAPHRGRLLPAGFFAIKKTAGGYGVMVGASDSTELNAEMDTCPQFTTKQLGTSLKLAFIDLTVTTGVISESVTVSAPYTESQRFRRHNSNHQTSCRDVYNGPKEGLRRYIWTDLYFAIAVDRCGRTSGPMSNERGGIMVFSVDGQTLVADIPAPYVPELSTGANGLFLAQNAQRAPVSAKDPKEVNVFKVSKDQQDALQVEMLSVYPRRPGTYLAVEDCHYVYGICGDKLLCVRIDKDTEDKIYLQLLSQGGTLPAVTTSTSTLGSTAAGRGFWIRGFCTSDGDFAWITYRYSSTEEITVPVSAPVLQTCLN